MLALFSFLAIILTPMFWVVMLCEGIVHYFSDILRGNAYKTYGKGDLITMVSFLFMTIPAYAHLLLLWGGA